MKVEGVDGLQRRLRAIGDHRELMRQMQVLTIAEAHARVPRRTGDLFRSIVPGTRSEDRAVVVAAKNYAAAVEYGTKPHEIVPVRRKALAWGGSRRLSGRLAKGSKPEFFAKRVRHPGSRAKPYLVPGARAAVDKSGIDFFVNAWNEAD
jgi:hypothetical protein